MEAYGLTTLLRKMMLYSACTDDEVRNFTYSRAHYQNDKVARAQRHLLPTFRSHVLLTS